MTTDATTKILVADDDLEILALVARHLSALPAQVVVNPTEHAQAEAAIKALGVKRSVGVTGGCLVPEVWLELPKRGKIALHNPTAQDSPVFAKTGAKATRGIRSHLAVFPGLESKLRSLRGV